MPLNQILQIGDLSKLILNLFLELLDLLLVDWWGFYRLLLAGLEVYFGVGQEELQLGNVLLQVKDAGLQLAGFWGKAEGGLLVQEGLLLFWRVEGRQLLLQLLDLFAHALLVGQCFLVCWVYVLA